MALLWTVVSVSFSIIITPFLMFLLAIIFLASIGKSLGVRRLYVKILLKIFEYGRQHIEIAKKDQRREMVMGSSCEGDGDGDADADATEDEGAAAASTAAAVERAAGAGAEAAAGADAGAGDAAHAPATRRPSPGGGAKAPACNGSAGALLPNGALPNSLSVISREDLILSPVPSLNSANGADKEGLPRSRSFETLKREFELADCLEFVKAGVEAIIEDEVTLRFEAEELKSWNLLTRTNSWYEFISWRLTVIWVLGFLVRYCFLLPLRVLICFIGVAWAVLSMAVLGFLPPSSLKRWLHKRAFIITFRILARCLSMVLTYHDTQYRPDKGGVCVANHTSPIDIITVSTESCFSLIGQRHGGFLGVLQRALARASPHIWFERSEVKDREAVAKRLRQHVSDPKNPPILIFPEGTCINNTSVMQFKKGSFEVGGVIYPVAIKYDPKFGDAFWNSSRFSMMQYLYMMMTSWAIVCDVWYLPPMYQKEGETAIDFANRVKSCIARQGGLVDLMWDGQLKRMKAKKEWKEAQQEEYSKRLKLE